MEEHSKYTRIPIGAAQALAGHENADFAIFIPGQSEHSPVLYRDAGGDLSNPDFDRLANTGISHIFIQASDIAKCESILEEQLSDVLHNPDISNDEKADLVYHVGTQVARDLTFVADPSHEVDRTAKAIDNVISFVLSDPNVATNMLYMAGHERTTASHMFVVSALAVLLGTEIYGDDQKMLQTLGLAGMMHDIGKLKIGTDILNKPSALTPEEVLLIQQHPIESVRLLGDDPHITPEVKRMILQHHERLDGRGYPLGISGSELNINSRLLTIVDCFHAMIGRRNYRKPLTPPEAIRSMNAMSGKQFDPELLVAWTAMFNRYWTAGIEYELKEHLDGAQNDVVYRHEHRPTPPPPKSFNERPKRFECEGNVTVQCIYAGRLLNIDMAPNNFVASVHDVSRSGLSLYSAHPMYRGEMIHVRINDGKNEFWVRGSVAWCKPHNEDMFRVGVQFMKRISDEEARSKTPVRSITEYDTGSCDLSAGSNARDTATQKSKKQDTPKTPLEKLQTLCQLKTIPLESQRLTFTLASSSDPAVREAAIEVLMKIADKPARSAIVEMLKDSEPGIRERAVIAVGFLEMHEADVKLRKLLNDHSKTVALRAAGVLGKLGDQHGTNIVLEHLQGDGTLTRLAARIYGDIVGHKFSANPEGIKAARRYHKSTSTASKSRTRKRKKSKA